MILVSFIKRQQHQQQMYASIQSKVTAIQNDKSNIIFPYLIAIDASSRLASPIPPNLIKSGFLTGSWTGRPKMFFVIILSLPKPKNDSYIVKSLLMLFYAGPFLLLTASSLVCGISINADISTSSKTFFHVFSSLVLPLKRNNFGKSTS